jgi:hypothetical protein
MEFNSIQFNLNSIQVACNVIQYFHSNGNLFLTKLSFFKTINQLIIIGNAKQHGTQVKYEYINIYLMNNIE